MPQDLWLIETGQPWGGELQGEETWACPRCQGLVTSPVRVNPGPATPVNGRFAGAIIRCTRCEVAREVLLRSDARSRFGSEFPAECPQCQSEGPQTHVILARGG